ncbi:glycosyltransferase [Oxalobacter vibrioformis]|uniref:Glycosyltransferase n=1 Tax=Oxalobacter vibrioformis TaxID=933080 RepID=A0A9E9P3P9_9BURK|nr:glycosyltransferase [Oxalobacter vibrioformis]WAW10470.1 glycosyltransferase [Oxalobacter vibrioformis]
MPDTPSRPPTAMKPVRLPASATLTLPRWGLILLCLLYILPGLFGRDPWKNIDAANFGVMWTMAKGTFNDWLYPNIAGQAMSRYGPMTFWAGAIFIKVFGWLTGAVTAARMATLFFFSLAAYSVWQTAFLLGRRTEAQPMRLAFGGHPEPDDYGRVLADGTLLIYLGCLGLIMFSHETSVNALYVALIAFTLFRSTCYVTRPGIKNAVLLGFSLGCLALTNGLITPAALYLGFIATVFFLPGLRSRTLSHLLIALVVTLALIFSWAIVSQAIHPYNGSPVNLWMQWNIEQISPPDLHSSSYVFRYALWGFWPAWPYACWAVYAWRRQLREPHVMLPLLFALIFFLLAVLNFQKEETLMLAMFPPLAILAAFGLPTMKRGAINAVDWFSVMSFTLVAAVIWVCWIAAQTGWPPKIARNALKLAPGFVPEFNILALLIATLVTISWFALVYWRLSRQPSVLWRAVVLSSGGVILCWLLLATLWLPWINYNKSYAPVAAELAENIPDKHICVDTNVGWAQRASFAYFGDIRFSGFHEDTCGYLLLQDTTPKRNRPPSPEFMNGMRLLWEGNRPSDRTERFRLYQYQQHK